MEDSNSIESFIAEFSEFERHSVGSALRCLSKEDSFVDHAEKLLALDARLKLVKRMAFARKPNPASCEQIQHQIQHIEIRAAQLASKRDELIQMSRGVAGDAPPHHADAQNELSNAEREVLKTAWRPTTAEIDECRHETSRLRQSMDAILESLERRDN